MRYSTPPCRLAQLAVLSSVLFACTPLPQRYLNSAHPHYGSSEYLADLARCRSENSTAIVTTVDDESYSAVRVNEVQVEGCMTRLSWAPVSTAVAWSPPLYRWPVW